MLNLKLRSEFSSEILRGTTIELSNESRSGATQMEAKDFFEITYPTNGVLKAIESIAPGKGKPIVILGDRGIGKSHILAVLYHVVMNPDLASDWMNNWFHKLRISIPIPEIRRDCLVIAESVHKHNYSKLWDIIFNNHPNGDLIRGRWQAANTPVPSENLLRELFRMKPVFLILDEFQTWYDSLTETAENPDKSRAFNFIQTISEIATKDPSLFCLVVTVRNGESDAYQQIHRVDPIRIDFKGAGSPEQMQLERRNMLLHRLFENRATVAEPEIENLIRIHYSENLRLLNVPASESEKLKKAFLSSWPFSPDLLKLLEDQILIATDAQETRDLIKILANLWKSRGDKSPVLTAADFLIDAEGTSAIGSLLDSVANSRHRNLRDKAFRNIIGVKEGIADFEHKLPNLSKIIASLWLRSITVESYIGATKSQIQLDITGDSRIDDNSFEVEVNTIVENSFNIHKIGESFLFKEEENPSSKLLASARNEREFANGEDKEYLKKEIEYFILGEMSGNQYRAVALPANWNRDPWGEVSPEKKPGNWEEKVTFLVLPHSLDKIKNSESPEVLLGSFLKNHIEKYRNLMIFILPVNGSENIYADSEFIIRARASMLAEKWARENSQFAKYHKSYQKELRELIKNRFNRFAILYKWDFANSANCEFHSESFQFSSQTPLPIVIRNLIATNLFVPEDFKDYLLDAAKNNTKLSQILNELKEPRAGGDGCIPWLGETEAKEKILKLCAEGCISINSPSSGILQKIPGEDAEVAWQRLKSKLPETGRALDTILIQLPTALPVSGGSGSPATMQSTHTAISSGNTLHSEDQRTSQIIGDISDATYSQITYRTLRSPKNSWINLLSYLESNGIHPKTKVKRVALISCDLQGNRLKDLISKLPDGLQYEVELEFEENSQ